MSNFHKKKFKGKLENLLDLIIFDSGECSKIYDKQLKNYKKNIIKDISEKHSANSKVNIDKHEKYLNNIVTAAEKNLLNGGFKKDKEFFLFAMKHHKISSKSETSGLKKVLDAVNIPNKLKNALKHAFQPSEQTKEEKKEEIRDIFIKGPNFEEIYELMKFNAKNKANKTNIERRIGVDRIDELKKIALNFAKEEKFFDEFEKNCKAINDEIEKNNKAIDNKVAKRAPKNPFDDEVEGSCKATDDKVNILKIVDLPKFHGELKGFYKEAMKECESGKKFSKFLELLYKLAEKLCILEKGGAKRKMEERAMEKHIRSWVTKTERGKDSKSGAARH